MARADQISQLQNDLHINHFHEIGADALAEKLYDAGYRLIPELTLLTDDEIREAMKVAIDEAQLYGDDGNPIPERKVAQSQRDACEKQIKDLDTFHAGKAEGIRTVVEWINRYETPRRYSQRPFAEFRPPEKEWHTFLKQHGMEG